MSSVDQQPIKTYAHPWLKGKTGWLKNKARRERRNTPNTFTDKDCEELIRKIEEKPHYISEKLGDELNRLMKSRDKAIISTIWIFFKRANEVLKLKRKDIKLTQTQLFVTFTISKKQKRYKICLECGERNGYRSNYCKKCSANLQEVDVLVDSNPRIVTKKKTLAHKLAKHIQEWYTNLHELNANDPESWFFPALRVVFSNGYFDLHSPRPMTVQNFNRILQRLDPTLTSSMFRYGGTEKYLLLGYTPRELKEIGDWSSSYMPEIYAEKKGLTTTQQRWSEDVR